MTNIPIRRIARGYYRATFRDLPAHALIIPVQFHKRLTFAQLAEWPATCEWSDLSYVMPPKTAQERIAL